MKKIGDEAELRKELKKTEDLADELNDRWWKLDTITSSYVILVFLPLFVLILPLFLTQVTLRLISRGCEFLLWKIERFGNRLVSILDVAGDFLLSKTPFIRKVKSDMEDLAVRRMELHHQAQILRMRLPKPSFLVDE